MDPRESTDGTGRNESTRFSGVDGHSDDEDYALAAMGISDGRMPLEHLGRLPSQIPPATPNHQRQPSVTSHPYRSLQSVPVPPPRPSSTSKPKYDTFALRHDGAMGHVAARNAAATSSSSAVLSRSSSLSTDIPLRPESPYEGPTGPSYPYQSYPQESRLARTASMTTTSTVAPIQEQAYSGPHGPSHNYSIYPQNVVAESEDEVPSHPPVGFPGLNGASYQRRLGPDGEELAMVGPDGHLEDLPPYSKYPNEAIARKTRPMVQLPVAGAGGIGLATRDPAFASREELSTPQSQLSSPSLILADSGTQINAAAAELAEKAPLKPWQKFAKRKVAGIVPAWALILAAIILVIFGIVLGAVFASLKLKHPFRGRHPNGTEVAPGASVYYTTMTLTTTFDATPLASTPTGIPALQTGTYDLPISSPASSQNGCLPNALQSDAWSCDIQPALPYQLEVTSVSGSSTSALSKNAITMTFGNNSLNFLTFGAQPPVVSTSQDLGLVIDTQDPQMGPAWFFQTRYDKTVVVHGDQLIASFNAQRRSTLSSEHLVADYTGRKSTAEPGDTPWICYWNGTLLETFIYVNQTNGYDSDSSRSKSVATDAALTIVSTSSHDAAGAQASAYASNIKIPVAYPNVVKVQERRIPSRFQSIPPYCIQHSVDGLGNVTPRLNSTGQPITLFLNETDATSVSPINEDSPLPERLEERELYSRGQESASSCGCVWLT